MKRFEAMTAVEAAAAIEQGTLTCEALARACLERIEAREPVVRAWTVVDPVRTIARARELDRTSRTGALHGLPIAVKDIIATVDFPTRYGSPIYARHTPPADAACVALVREAGAVIPGKTVTTEFAYYHPGPTTNPSNPAHTPGGSSSGSAAAVADAMAPLALGTQTAGSVIRPAAFCGVAGFKPTFGRQNLSGVKALAPSLDTLGCMARSVEDLELLRATLAGEAYQPLDPPAARLRIGLYRGAAWSSAEASSQQAVLDVAGVLRRISDVEDIDHPDDGVGEDQKTIMAFEVAQSLAFEYRSHRGALSAQLRTLIETGLAVPYREYVAAQQRASRARVASDGLFHAYDALLAPSAPGEAPFGLDSTGDPVFNRRWTLLGVPAVTIPTHAGPQGLPIGVQLIGGRDGDRTLLALARWLLERVRSGD
jgi:Asp-tRNA(Asn)/Glu-tRNA(Gln) amidotransferase A subunit family amidase